MFPYCGRVRARNCRIERSPSVRLAALAEIERAHDINNQHHEVFSDNNTIQIYCSSSCLLTKHYFRSKYYHMAPRFPPSLEDTISIYKNKYLIDLEDENDDATLLDSIADDNGRHSGDEEDHDLRAEPEDGVGDDETSGSNRRKSKLPRDLAGLMGQANVSFARGESNDAILMCQEIIRLAPRCSEPFISLAEYYADAGDEEKAEQLYLIAAYLQPSSVDLWVRVAESATKRREFRLATTCYTKAIRADKNESSIVYHLRRCNLYEKLGDQKKALRGYENLISVLGPDDEKFGLELTRGIARIYFTENKYDDCIRTFEGALEKYSNQLSDEDLAQLCHCYNNKHAYIKTIDLIVKKCQVQVKLDNEDWSVSKMTTHHGEGSKKLNIEIRIEQNHRRFTFINRCHFVVAFISLGYHDRTIEPLVSALDSAELPKHRQSLYDIAKAYFSQAVYTKAKEILLRLTSQRDSQAASVWLLYSQCLKNLNEIDEAIAGYRKVLTYDPDDYSSRLALSNLLSVQGRSEEALEVTKQPLFTEKPVDIPLLYQSCQLLEQSMNWNEYCRSAKALILTDMFYTKHSKEIMSMVTSKSQRTRLENLRYVQRELNLDPYLYRQKSVGAKLDSSTMLKTFLRYIEILFHIQKDFQELKRICFSAYTCPNFECYESSIDFYTATACICSRDKEFTYNHLKLLASRNPENYQLWNLLSIAMSTIYQDLRHGRFCLRQFLKNPEILPLAVFNGHNALMSGSYKHALGEYMSVFKERPNDPLAALCIALTYLSLSCQKYVSSKYLCLFQMMAFLHTYLELRGNCQEAMYNIGRAFHQMNMLDKAVIFYKKALTMDDRPRIKPLQESKEEFDEIFSVRREAAFNLALIYKNSQSHRLAYQVIKDNFTI